MLYRPLWTEGTLLCPQHMQQQDRYHEQHLAARLGAIAPHPWGVLALRFDAAALQAGQLALSHLRAVLPDGTAVDLDDDSPQRPPARAIAPHFPAHAERLTVHLVAPSMRPGVANVAAEPGARYRYRSVTRAIFDLTLGRSSRDIELGELNLALRLGDESQTDHVALPIAELLRDPGGAFILDDTFIPPIVALTGSSWLRGALNDLTAQVAARRRALADDHRRQHDLGRALLFHSLSGALPPLRHLVDAPETSPLDLYRQLLRLLGELRSFATTAATTTEPTELTEPAAFNFRDLRSCFGPLLHELGQRVVDTLPDRFLRVPLEARPDGLWIGELRDDRLLRGASFVLAVESEADPAALAGDLPALTRIAAWRRISLIVRNNVLGAPIRHIAHPPVELPVLPRHTYFTVTADDPSWLEVLRERNVAVYLPRPHGPERTRVSLLAIPSAEA